jgi:hypothetical protein
MSPLFLIQNTNLTLNYHVEKLQEEKGARSQKLIVAIFHGYIFFPLKS